MRPGRHVRDDVELLARLLECTLEREVVVRRDDELVRRPSLAQERGQPGEEPMQRAGLHRGLEARVELVVQRPRALHRRHVLRDAGEVDGPVVGNRKRRGEVLGEVAGAVEADDGHDPTGEKGPHDLALLVRRCTDRPRCEARFVAEDLRLEPLELRAGLDSEFVDEAGACILVHLQGLRLPARTIQREHELPAERLAKRMLADEPFQLADHVAVTTELEVGVDLLPAGDEPKLLEPTGLRLREVVERELRQCRPTPQGERCSQRVAPLLGGKPPRVGKRALEAAGVDLIRRDAEHVARRTRLEDIALRARAGGARPRSAGTRSPSSAPPRPTRGRSADP